MSGEVPAGALEVGRLPLELLRGGAYQGLAAALEERRIVCRTLPENRRLLYAVQPLRNIVERLHELGELGLVVLRRLDLFELVESRFQPAPHHGHFRADLRALRLDRAPERVERGVGYLNDIQGFPDPALYPDIAEADCRLVVMHSAQRDGIATRTGHLRPEDALDEIVRFFEARVSALRRSGVAADRLILDPGMGFFLSPAPETSLHVLSNLQKLKSALGLPLLVSLSRKSFLGATVGLPVKDLGPASLAAELHAIGNGADYVRTHAPGDLRSAITFSETLAKFRSRDARDRGLDHA